MSGVGTIQVIWRAVRVVALLLLASVAGCEPHLDPEQYGKVIHQLPQIKGADTPYPLPELDVSASQTPAEPAAAEK